MTGLLSPGSTRAAGVADDQALVAAMLRVEVAWSRALVVADLATEESAAAVAGAAEALRPDAAALAVEAQASGNPVVPLVGLLRDSVGSDDVGAVHRGLTSQDVLDTALVLVAREGLTRVATDLRTTGDALAELARTHRDTVAVGRTLTQHAVPTTFGLKAVQWLTGIDEAGRAVTGVRDRLPVQYGGAAGTRALTSHLAPAADHRAVLESFAADLGLQPSALPWHTRRATITRIGDALVSATDALGVLAADVLLLGRPEIGEVREGAAEGRGGSSTMPHKQNPVLSVLVRAAALQAPLLAAQLHLAAATTHDERPGGAWHSEWPALARLLELTVTAGSQAAELAACLEVRVEAMTRRAEAAAADLLAERGAGDPHPQSYLGEAGTMVDEALVRWQEGASRG